MKSKFSAVLIALLAILGTGRCVAATGSVAAVLQDGAGFRAEVTNVGTVTGLSCNGEKILCQSGYRFCTLTGSVGAVGLETQGLGVSIVTGNPLPLRPFWLQGAIRRYLTSLGPDVITGAPLYDTSAQFPAIPDGTTIHLLVDNRPTGVPAIGVQSLFRWNTGTCEWKWHRRVFNLGGVDVRLTGAKEFTKPCATDGFFTTDEGVAQVTVIGDSLICHAFLDPESVAGNVQVGSFPNSDLVAESGSCSFGTGFSSGAVEGDRWLAGGTALVPAAILRRCGCPGSDKVFCWTIRLQCELRPPGDPGDCECDCSCDCCQPQECDEPPGEPGEPICPEGWPFWRDNPDLWPVSSLIIGGRSYGKAALLGILNASPADPSVLITKHLIAALLSIAAGSDPAPIQSVLDATQGILAGLGPIPAGIDPRSDIGRLLCLLSVKLSKYPWLCKEL